MTMITNSSSVPQLIKPLFFDGNHFDDGHAKNALQFLGIYL
jgi:hypothetical protein